MQHERFRWLAAVIYAHPNHELHGRTRLQKEIYLLQRLGMPSDYDFRMHHYGTYSDGVQSDINLIERLGLVEEDQQATQDAERTYSLFTATAEANLSEFESYKKYMKQLNDAEPVVLELAATLDAFYQKTEDHERSLALLKRMKPKKSEEDKLDKAINLLKELGLAK